MEHIDIDRQRPVADAEFDHVEAVVQLEGEFHIACGFRQQRDRRLMGIKRVVGDELLANLGVEQPRRHAFIGDHNPAARLHYPIHLCDSLADVGEQVDAATVIGRIESLISVGQLSRVAD